MLVSKLRLAAACIVASCALTQPAFAAETIDISSGINENLANYTNGSVYPNGGSTVTINGVSFKLAGAATGEAGIVQTTFRNKPGTVTFNVAPVTGIEKLYTLINTAYGTSTGVEAGHVEFLFNGGLSHKYTLTSGVNTRDHYGSRSVSSAFGTAAYNANLRLDAQEILLPKHLQKLTLQQVRLVDNPVDNSAGGSPFLAGLSYSAAAVPEPATWAMMIVGFGAVGGAMRTRRRRVSALA